MKYLFIPLLALTVFTSHPAIEAKCPQPEPGPTGPLTTDFISATSSGTIQVIENTAPSFELVGFPIVTAQNNIQHPNTTDFVVERDGVYLITWAGTGRTNADFSSQGISPRIVFRLVLNGSDFSPQIQTFQDTFPIDLGSTPDAFSFGALSGQTILQLNAGDTLQLKIIGAYVPATGVFFEIMDNLFTVTRIAEPLLVL